MLTSNSFTWGVRIGGIYSISVYAALFDAGYIGLDNYWTSAVVKQRRVPNAPRVNWASFDHDRAIVECFFGRLRRVFGVLNDMAFRLTWDKLEATVSLCVALLNFRHRHRGHALTEPPRGFMRRVPTPVPSSDVPVGAVVTLVDVPPTHRPDCRVGLTPLAAYMLLQERREDLAAMKTLAIALGDVPDDAVEEVIHTLPDEEPATIQHAADGTADAVAAPENVLDGV